MKDHIGQLVVGVILVIAGATASYFLFRPTPLAFARCDPLRGVAALSVRCDNESNYHRHVIWAFGEEGKPRLKDQDVVRYMYETAGKYTITLTAHGHGSPGSWTQLIEVRTPTAIRTPIKATVTARTREDRFLKAKTFSVSNTKDNHPSAFTDHSQAYSEVFRAEPGFKIVATDFRAISAARASDINQRIAPDGSKVDFSYRLTSGPKIDRYRGWLRGDLILKLEQLKPAQNVTLVSDLNITQYGSYPLPTSVTPESIASISVIGEDGDVLAFGNPGGILVSEKMNVAFSLEEHGGQLFLQVKAKN